MKLFRTLTCATLIAIGLTAAKSQAAATDVSRVLEPGKKLDDPRLGKPRTLNSVSQPWNPPATKAEWEKESKAIRERVLVSVGLWPMLPKGPLHPVIHGKIDRGDYTVEKVFFASLPGHYVTGSLYRPKQVSGKVPGVLSPYGHWENGRFYDAGDAEVQRQLEQKGETSAAAAHFPLQARAAQLARLGCVVFHYDMVGRADSKPIKHGEGFADAEADLRLQSAMGLQTFNSIRALDFLVSLPEVDSHRIGVTGASGGGTQTYMLCAVDPRPTVAFPAVMVSSAMQGGCVCETADYLRIGINNVAIAALFAPKPMELSGANDWTINIEKKGLPELKQVYSLYGAGDNVNAKCFPQFYHNYNRWARELMYNWFNAHLNLGRPSPVVEQEFTPIAPKDLSVFDADHPRPADSKSALELRKYLTEVADRQFADLLPKDQNGVKQYRHIVGTAARVMFEPGVLEPGAIHSIDETSAEIEPGLTLTKRLLVRQDDKGQVPYVSLEPQGFKGTVVVWIDGAGKSRLFGGAGKPNPFVQKLLAAGDRVVSADLFLTGEFVESGKSAALPKVDDKYAGYTFAYNRPVLANRVRDVLTAVAAARDDHKPQSVTLVGTGKAGLPVLLAAGLLRRVVQETIADSQGDGFEDIREPADPTFLPGALKYGGLGGLAALVAPEKLEVFGTDGLSTQELAPLKAVYQASGAPLTLEPGPLTDEIVVKRLLKDGR